MFRLLSLPFAFIFTIAILFFNPFVASANEPPSISALKLHLDASNIESFTLGDEGEVLEWRNSGVDEIVFTPSSGASIVHVEDVINGLPAVRFSESHLSTLSPAALSMTNDIGGFTAFAVSWSQGEATQNIFRIGRGEGGTAAGLRIMLGRLNENHRFLGRRVDSGGFQTVAGGPRLIEEWGIDTGIIDFENRNAFLYINGVEVDYSDEFLDGGRTSPTDSQMFRIGSDHASQFWDGDIAEILMFDRTLTVSERQEVELYLADKYGIPYAVAPETIDVSITRANELQFDTLAGRTYSVFRSANGQDWGAAIDDPIEGTGEPVTLYFLHASSGEVFRVVERLTQQHTPATNGTPTVPEIDGLRLQLDATNRDSLVLDPGEMFVEEWHNSYGDEMIFVPNDPEVRPFYFEWMVNNHPAIRFGPDRFLETVSEAALGMTNDVGGITAYGVGWNTGGGSQNYLRIGRGELASAAGLRFMLGRRTNDSRILGRRVDTGGFVQLAGGWSQNEQWGIDSGFVDYVNRRAALYINGEEVAATDDFLDGGNTSPTDSQMFRIGNDHADQFWQGDIVEILVFDRALTLEEGNDVGVYLSDKYGIPYTLIIEEEVSFATTAMVKVNFTTELGNEYRVDVTEDLVVWDPAGEEVVGTGVPASVFFPLDARDRAFFRVVRVD